MSTKSCVACGNRDTTIPYFKLPTNLEARDRWLKNCDILPPYNFQSQARICSLHFADDAFTVPKTTTVRRRRLRVGAEPSIRVAINENENCNVLGTKTSVWRCCFICGRLPPSEQRSMFRFPLKIEQREEWLKLLGQENASSSINVDTRLCSEHFVPTDIFQNSRLKRITLRSGALPIKPTATLCSDNSVEMQVDGQEIPTGQHFGINTNERTEIFYNEAPLVTSGTASCSTTSVDMNVETQEVLRMQQSNPSMGNAAQPGEISTPTGIRHSKKKNEHMYSKKGQVERRVLFKKPRYVGDVRTPHLKTPRSAKQNYAMAREVIRKQRLMIRALQKQLRMARKKCKRLEQLPRHLKALKLLNQSASNNLLANVPDTLKALVLRSKKRKVAKFQPELRKFALLLQFYSTKAYLFVRKAFGNLLPALQTLRKFCSSVNMEPGISKEAMQAIQARAKQTKKSVICNLVIDEMTLKEHIEHKAGGRQYGFVNLGENFNHKNMVQQKAQHALVFLLVALNDNWKVPVAYFLIKSLDAIQRSKLLSTTLSLLQDHNIHVHSITYDGAYVNNAMANKLGAITDLDAPKHQFYFQHPTAGHRVYLFPDPCHMLKNVRNALGETYKLKEVPAKKVTKDENEKSNEVKNGTTETKTGNESENQKKNDPKEQKEWKEFEEPFVDGTGCEITWRYIFNLNEIQKKEGVHLANKITDRHIKYSENVMSVRLAGQTLSNSAADSLDTLEESKDIPKGPSFEGAKGTAEFCRQFNDMFDFLNCRTPFKLHTKKQPYCVPLTKDKKEELKKWADEKINYIQGLRRKYDNIKLTSFRRKCGFQGFIICLQNVFALFDDLTKTYSDFEYLLTYKLLQDAIENLFSAVRMMGGFSNNPTPYKFQCAIRRLVIHHEVVHSSSSNCADDQISILTISSGGKKKKDDDDDDDVLIIEDDFENFELFKFQDVELPSSFVMYAVKYISGYIVYRIKQTKSINTCTECLQYITGTAESDPSPLTKMKNRGPLKYASRHVIDLCTYLESVIKTNANDIFNPTFFDTCLKYVKTKHSDYFRGAHFQETDHGSTLAHYITKMYLVVRLHHADKVANNVEKYVRRIQTKLTLFMHQ